MSEYYNLWRSEKLGFAFRKFRKLFSFFLFRVRLSHWLIPIPINDQLNKNGSLRKSCGKKISVTANGKTVEAEIRRSCKGETVCPGENAIALSLAWADELGIQNELVKGKEVEWTYLG